MSEMRHSSVNRPTFYRWIVDMSRYFVRTHNTIALNLGAKSICRPRRECDLGTSVRVWDSSHLTQRKLTDWHSRNDLTIYLTLSLGLLFTEFLSDTHTSADIVGRVKAVESPPYRPDIPGNASSIGESGVVDLMKRCWGESPEQRPSFDDVLKTLDRSGRARYFRRENCGECCHDLWCWYGVAIMGSTSKVICFFI